MARSTRSRRTRAPRTRTLPGAVAPSRPDPSPPPPSLATAPAPPARDAVRVAAFAALASFVVYAFTTRAAIAGGDAGELASVACTNGVAHPPGYPLWTVIARAFFLVAPGTPAFRVGLASASCASIACALLAFTVAYTSRRASAGALAAVAFGTAPRVWTYATTPEVFALNNALVAALVALAVVHATRPTPRRAALVALAGGLALANHHTAIVYVLALVPWAIATLPRESWTLRNALQIPGAFALGLLPYARLPIASRTAGAWRWGDASTLHGFLDHVLRREYGTFRLSSSDLAESSGTSARMAFFADETWHGLGALVVLLAVAGLVATVRTGTPRRRVLAVVIAIATVAYVTGFASLANLPVSHGLVRGVLARFWLMPHWIVCAWTGIGWAVLVQRAIGRIPAHADLVLVLAGALAAVVARWPSRAEYRTDFVEAYGHAVLDPLARESILLVRGDLPANAVSYLQRCAGVRPDVRVVDEELVTYDWYVRAARERDDGVVYPGARYHPFAPDGFSLRQFVDANVSRRAVYVYGGVRPGDGSLAGAYTLVPAGFAGRIVVSGSPDARPDRWLAAADEALAASAHRDTRTMRAFDDEHWESVVASDHTTARHAVAYALLTDAIAHGDTAGFVDAATRFEQILRDDPRAPSYVWKNLGIAYGRLVQVMPDARARMIDAWRHYVAVAPPDDRDLAAIRQQIR